MFRNLVHFTLERCKSLQKSARKSLKLAELSEKRGDYISAWKAYEDAGVALLQLHNVHERLMKFDYLIAVDEAGNDEKRKNEIFGKLERDRSNLEVEPLKKIKECFEKAWKLSKHQCVPALIYLAKVHEYMGMSRKSIELYSRGIDLILKSGGFEAAGWFLADAGIISNRIKDFERARELLERSIEAMEKTEEYQKGDEAFFFEKFSDICILASETLRQKGEKEKANEYLRKAADGYVKAGKCDIIIESIMMDSFERWGCFSFASHIYVKLRDFSSAAECCADAYTCWPFEKLMPWDLVHAILFSKLAGSWNKTKTRILESKATMIISGAKAKMASEQETKVGAEFSIASYSILEALLDISNGDPARARKKVDEILRDRVDLGIADVNLDMANAMDMLLNRDLASAIELIKSLEKRFSEIRPGENGIFEAVKRYRHAAEVAFLSEIVGSRPAETALIELIRERLGISHIINAIATGKPLPEEQPFGNLNEDARFVLDLVIKKFREDLDIKHLPLNDAGWFSINKLEVYAHEKTEGKKWSRGTFYKRLWRIVGTLEREQLIQMRESKETRGRKAVDGSRKEFRLKYMNMRLSEHDPYFRKPFY